LEILELLNYMRQSNLNMASIFKATQRGLISRQEFENALRDVGFQSRDMTKLIEALDTKGTRMSVSLDRLQEFMSKGAGRAPSNMTAQMAREQYHGFDPKVRQILQRISDTLKKNNIPINKLFESMDANRDGVVDRDEFVMTMPQIIQIPGIEMRDYAIIFNALDLNNDGTLSLNEFGLFLEGAKVDKMQKMRDIDPKIIEEM
jgi:Ca2+-binding EF-hand superfamily protein